MPLPHSLWSVPHFSCYWTPSPLQAHWGRGCHTHLLLRLIYSSCGVVSLPPFSGAFHRTATVTRFPHSKVAGHGCHSCLLWPPCLFSVHAREFSSPSLQSSGCPALVVRCLFFSAACLFSFFFLFSLGGGQSVQGAMLICPRECHVPLICSPGGFPSRLGTGIWRHGSPPGFSF
jgi:hypothetical protein